MKKIFTFLYFALVLIIGLMPLSTARLSAASVNLVANPSVETVDASNANLPQNWLQGKWGTNTTTFSYPSTGHTGTRSTKVETSSYTSGDAKWYFAPVAVTPGSQYVFNDYYQSSIPSSLVAQFDDGTGNMTYQTLLNPAAASVWTQTNSNFTTPSTAKYMTIFHLINNVGWLQTDDASLTSYTVPSAPTVSVTSPGSGSTVAGTILLSANASDSSGISGVQFRVDGINVGSEVTTAPYQLNWDSKTVANGTHQVTAIARNTSGLNTTSQSISTTISNSTPTPVPTGNLIANSSMETADPADSSQPQNWTHGGWGANTIAFSYVTNGGSSGTHSVKLQVSTYTDGDAKWYFTPVVVTPGAEYVYSDYYQANIPSSLVAQFDDGTGKMTYQTLLSPAAASGWTKSGVTFSAPATAKYVTVFHLINSVGSLQIDDASLVASTAPSVVVSSPSNGSSVSGQVQLNATAYSPSGVASVQFRVDGLNQGSLVSASPYQTNWDSTLISNGTHVITAVVTARDGQTAISSAVNVNVNNVLAAGSNMTPNPSLEIASSSNPKLPQDWITSKWGTNTTTFSYLSTGHSGSHSAKVQITNYTSGDAKWYSTPQKITQDTQYTYSDYYQSNIYSDVNVAFDMSDGSTVYEYIGRAEPSAAAWAQFKTNFSVPIGALNATVYHLIQGVGYLTIDDVSTQQYSPVGFSRPIITITFDDGIGTQYTNGLPLLQKYNLPATFYIISGMLGQSGYMTNAQVKSMYASGEEIGSHTVSHPDLTSLSSAQLTTELSQSQASLQQLIGVPVKNFAAPYGLVNTSVLTQVKKYYQTARSVEWGFNDKASFSPYNIKVQDVDLSTTTAQVADWTRQARATNTWLVLVYHAVDPNSAAVGQYDVLPAQLDAQLSVIKNSGIQVETLAQALAEIQAQL